MYIIDEEKIDFYWDSQQIFELISYRTAVQSQSRKTENEDNTQFIVTEDNMEYIVEAITPAFIKLFDLFSSIALPTTEVYIHKASIELAAFVSGFSVKVYRNSDWQLVISEHTIENVSRLCMQWIAGYIVNKWCGDNRLSDMASITLAECDELEQMLKNEIVRLKKRPYQRSY